MTSRIKVGFLRWFYRWDSRRAWRNHTATGTRREDITLPGAGGPIPARIHTPETLTEHRGLLLYLHGGGWVIGDLATHDAFCAHLATACGWQILAVDYRLAPEHPYPAAAEDCLAAARWLASGPAEVQPYPGPLVVAGDSAGGNLAGVVARELPAQFDGQCLIYPVIRHYPPTDTDYPASAKASPLTPKLMRWFWDAYRDPDGEPLNAENTPLAVLEGAAIPDGLPPALVMTAELDPLCEEGQAYARTLAAAGIPCEHHFFAGEQHGFVCSQGPTPGHQDALKKIVDWLQKLREQEAVG